MSVTETKVVIRHDTGYGELLIDHINIEYCSYIVRELLAGVKDD